jgi:hypothetical protein
MEKVYLLLRNNVQKGPFTASELLQEGLKPKDLIWIEGKSTAWAFMKDLEEITKLSLSPNQTEANLTQSSNEVLSKQSALIEKTKSDILISDDIEQRSELIRQRASTYVQEHPQSVFTPQVQEERITGIPFAEANPIDLVIHKKGGATITAGQLLMVAITTTIIAAAWNGKISLIPEKINSPYTAVASAPSIFHIQPKKVEKAVEVPVVEPTSITSIDVASYAAKEPAFPKAKKSIDQEKEVPKEEMQSPVEGTATITSSPAVTSPVPATPKKEETVVKEQAEAVKKSEETEQKTTEATTTEVSGKKKTLGEALKGIFKKKKKGSPEETID